MPNAISSCYAVSNLPTVVSPSGHFFQEDVGVDTAVGVFDAIIGMLLIEHNQYINYPWEFRDMSYERTKSLASNLRSFLVFLATASSRTHR